MSHHSNSTSEMTHSHHLCWSCKEEVGEGPFCPNCIKIQPVTALGNYFDLFEINRSYQVDETVIRKKFYELSRRFHPDFYLNKTEDELLLARNNSAYLNTAFAVLIDPIRRAEYLLSLAAGNYKGEPAPPQELFEEILEIGELLLEPDIDDVQKKQLGEARQTFADRSKLFQQELGALFERLLGGDESAKEQVESRLNNIKYIRTILGRIDKRISDRT